jgi:hypothetical protein
MRYLSLLVLGLLLAGSAYWFLAISERSRYAAAFGIVVLVGSAAIEIRRLKSGMRAVAKKRGQASICAFARCFDTRQVDTWAIRAVHEEVQSFLDMYVPAFPVRASDDLLSDLRLEPEDVDGLLENVAGRTGRSLDATADNPYYGRIRTVADLVLFIDAQPRL